MRTFLACLVILTSILAYVATANATATGGPVPSPVAVMADPVAADLGGLVATLQASPVKAPEVIKASPRVKAPTPEARPEVWTCTGPIALLSDATATVKRCEWSTPSHL